MIWLDIDKNQLSELVLKLQAGDGKAFEQIYNLTNKSAYFTALKITKNEDDAQDVLQEAYIKLLEKIGELDKPESFMSWFNMMVANKAKDYMRKYNPNLFTDNVISGGKDDDEEYSVFDTIEEDNDAFIPGAGIEQAELQRDVMGLIENLSDEKRTAILLYYYNEMTTKQIAESLGVNENTVKSRLVQAKKDLAKSIKELEKKNGKLLGVAPISIVIWALKGASAVTGASFTASGAAAATLTAVTAGSAAVLSTAAGAGTAAATTGVATKIVAGIVAASIIGGGAVMGTKAVNDKIKAKASETTSVSESQSENGSVKDDRTYVLEDDDRNYVLVDKEDKEVDIVVGMQDMDYGLKGVVENYEINKDGTKYYYDSVALMDRTGYSASYTDLLPAAQSNMKSYSAQINSAYADINSARSSMKKLTLDSSLTEQANVRALEIANSGLNFSKRPDGSDYTTIFAENGKTTGTMLECRAYGLSSEEEAMNRILADYSEEIKNADIDKIGIGVALEPQSRTYVYVVHLYSSKGSANNVDNSASSEFLFNLSKRLYEAEGLGVDIEQKDEKIYDVIYDIPVIGELTKIDIPIDKLIKAMNDSRDKTNETIIELIDKLSGR